MSLAVRGFLRVEIEVKEEKEDANGKRGAAEVDKGGKWRCNRGRGGGRTMMGFKERVFAPLVAVSLEELVPQDHFYPLGQKMQKQARASLPGQYLKPSHLES
jgi:hypothetical protein